MNSYNNRIILHCDLNSYFASVELLSHPELKGRPMAVCGLAEERHGIVLAKTPEAKASGVVTGEAIWQAKEKCPGLVIMNPHYDLYDRYSRAVKDIYYEYTDAVESFGIDECWLDVTGSTHIFGSGEKIANEIRERVKSETGGLTVSVGVSFCKVFAKLGSDMKKPDAVTLIPFERFRNIVWPLPASDMLGVGPATARKLASYGIVTIGDIARYPRDFFVHVLGKCGTQVWGCANGLDCTPVADCNSVIPVKSVGHGNTGLHDLTDNGEVRLMLLELAEDVGHRLRMYGLSARRIELSVRDNKMNIFQFQDCLPYPTQSWQEIGREAYRVFLKSYDWHLPVRALTVRGISLENENIPCQLDLFSDFERHDKLDRLEKAIEDVRSRYGRGCIDIAGLI